jgi:hypothetical protein
MQIDPSGDQHPQAQQYSRLSREQEFNMDTSDDHAVEQQLLGDVQTHSHQTAQSTSSNSAPADSIGHGSFSTPATSFDVSKDEIKMPLSEYELLCEAVKADPYNPLRWKGLIDHSERSRDISKIRATYDWLLDTFPNTVRSAVSIGETSLAALSSRDRIGLVRLPADLKASFVITRVAP